MATGGAPQERTGSGQRVRRRAEKAKPLGGHEKKQGGGREHAKKTKLRNSDGSPTRVNPGFVDALPGPSSATGVPNFIIRKFRVPPFLLPIYQAAGIEYGVRWEVLAAINEIETDYGRNLNVSSAGAVGWMQFMPSTWRMYGVDANRDGRKDPYNPVDAIFASARYLAAAGLREGRPPGGVRLQPRRLVRGLGPPPRPADRRRARRPRGLAHRPHRGTLPRLRPRPLRRRPARAAAAEEGGPGPERRPPDRGQRAPPQHRHLHAPGRPRGRRERRRDQGDRREQGARALRPPPGRVRQPLHLRAPRIGGELLPRAEERPGSPRRPRHPGPRQGRRSQAHCAGLGRQPARGQSPSGRGPAGRARAHRLPAREGAPVRAPRARGSARVRRPRADDGLEAAQEGRVRDLRRLLLPSLRPRPLEGPPEAPAQGRARDRRHRARTGRAPRHRRRGPSRLLHPPRRPGRAHHRPEADPRRLEAARGHGHLPGLRAQRALRQGRRRVDRPDPADVEAAAGAPRALRRAHRGLPRRP